MSRNEKRKIPTKNYIILLCMFAVVFLLMYYLYSWYVVYNDYKKDTPIIDGLIPEINKEEMSHYVQDSTESIIYLCTASDSECRNFEKSFKKLIETKSLEEKVTYVNLNGTDKALFTDEFNNQYSYKKKLKNNYPAFVAFSGGEIVDILQGKENRKLTIKDVERFIDDNITS